MYYIPLKVKTNYSLLSSLVNIDELIQKSKDLGVNAIGICDDNLYGVIEFYFTCKKNNIKPIIGLEVIIDNEEYLLYAVNYTGYQKLCKINTIKLERNLVIDDIYSKDLILITKENKNLTTYFYKYYYGLNINAVRCLEKEEQPYLKYIYLIRDGKKESDNVSYEIKDNYLFMPQITESEENIYKEIYNSCDVVIERKSNLLPRYSDDLNFNSKEYLEALCKKGLQKRNKVSKEYLDRLKYELKVINEMGFNDYFLVVWDYVKYAKKNDILVGPGRGSAASSLVSYVLGITSIDPIEHNLFFERFLNSERITMPDIDIDFDAEKRDLMIDYVTSKYGDKRAVQIITFGTMALKQTIRDVARVFDINNLKLEKILSLCKDDTFNEKDLLKINDNEIRKLIDISKHIIGIKRHTSVHAAGVIISPEDIDSYIPLDISNGKYLTGIDMTYLEDLGFLKMDFLSLKNLSLLDEVYKKIGRKIDIPLNDKKTYELFSTGNTSGIFQFESVGMKKFLCDLKPSCFSDLIAAIALYRPGPMQNINEYVLRKHGKRKIVYPHPNLESILRETYGVIVYQEQIMKIANVLAGYTLGEADILRRAMSKKKHDIMEKERVKFIEKSVLNGYTKEVATSVFDLIYKFSDYGFNKAHSVSYALIGYNMAYLKAHYGSMFISSILSNVNNESKVSEYVNECLQMNISVMCPDINSSEEKFINYGNSILFSLSSIKNVGTVISKIIIEERKNGSYTDFFDFVSRTYFKGVNRKNIQYLIDSGAFNLFGYNKQTLYNNIDIAINYAELVRDLDISLVEKPIMNISEEFELDKLLELEYNALGVYITSHPASKYQKNITTKDIRNYFDKIIEIPLYIERVNEILTKKNEMMAFVTASDLFGKVNLTIFPSTLKNIKLDLKRNVYLIKGKVEKRFSEFQIIVNDIAKLD